MKSTRLLMGLPLVLGLGILGVAVMRRSDPGAAPRVPDVSRTPGPSGVPLAAVAAPRAIPPVPVPASEPQIARATADIQFRTAYGNYRTALATGNRTLEQGFYKVLVGHRDVALTLAQEDLSNARTAYDRELALQTLEGLRR